MFLNCTVPKVGVTLDFGELGTATHNKTCRGQKPS